MGVNDSIILEAVDIGIIDTIQAFIRFRPDSTATPESATIFTIDL